MTLHIFDSDKRLPIQISERIKSMIIQGGYRRGDPMPSYRDLCKKFRVSLVTIKRAMDELVRQEVIYSLPAKGTFVNKELSPDARKLSQIGLVFYGSRSLFFASSYLMEMFQGIMQESEKMGVDVKIFSMKNKDFLETNIESLGVDGVILIGVSDADYARKFYKKDLPVVVLDSLLEGVSLDYILCDNEKAAESMVDFLVSSGHRHIGYVDGWSTGVVSSGDNYSEKYIMTSDQIERRDGYLKAMKKNNLEANATVYSWCEVGLSPQELVSTIAEQWKKRSDRPTALVCCGAGDVGRVIREFSKRGIDVPGEVSVAAAASARDHIVDSRVVACNRMVFEDMGRKGVAALVRRSKMLRPLEPSIERIDFEFIRGDTVREVNNTE